MMREQQRLFLPETNNESNETVLYLDQAAMVPFLILGRPHSSFEAYVRLQNEEIVIGGMPSGKKQVIWLNIS